MLFVSGFFYALCVVVAQALYNQAVQNANFELTKDFLLSTKFVSMLLSPHMIGGFVLFGAAALVNFWMLSKFEFSHFQAVTVTLILAITIVIGWRFFSEEISAINLAGFAIMVVGVILATLR